jgi:hypothetical protein
MRTVTLLDADGKIIRVVEYIIVPPLRMLRRRYPEAHSIEVSNKCP